MDNHDQCPECSQGESESMIACHHCNQWFHFNCVGLTPALVDKIEEYYCVSCEEKERKLTCWKKLRADSSKKAEKRQFYYDVEKIEKHNIRRCGRIESRFFYIKWKGYPASQNTWEMEYHLDGCFDLLEKYIRENNLRHSTIDGIVGSSVRKPVEFNEKNWSSMFDVIEEFSRFKSYYFSDVDIIFDKWTSFGEQDGLYFLKFQSHCFVILYYGQRRVGYIADGGNLFKTDESVARNIYAMLNIRLRSCEFTQQSKIDHCGSSAVLIGLELLRAYKTKTMPGKLVSPLSWRERVTKHLHKFESATLNVSLNDLNKRLSCPNCNKYYRRSERRNYFQHLAKCSKSE